MTRTVRPSQLADCVNFYALLGFEPVPAPPGIDGRAVWLAPRADGTASPPGAHIHLMLADDAQPEQGHIAFVVDRYEATIAAIGAAGFGVEPRREHWGSPRAYIRDPASNLVELMATAPAEYEGAG